MTEQQSYLPKLDSLEMLRLVYHSLDAKNISPLNPFARVVKLCRSEALSEALWTDPGEWFRWLVADELCLRLRDQVARSALKQWFEETSKRPGNVHFGDSIDRRIIANLTPQIDDSFSADFIRSVLLAASTICICGDDVVKALSHFAGRDPDDLVRGRMLSLAQASVQATATEKGPRYDVYDVQGRGCFAAIAALGAWVTRDSVGLISDVLLGLIPRIHQIILSSENCQHHYLTSAGTAIVNVLATCAEFDVNGHLQERLLREFRASGPRFLKSIYARALAAWFKRDPKVAEVADSFIKSCRGSKKEIAEYEVVAIAETLVAWARVNPSPQLHAFFLQKTQHGLKVGNREIRLAPLLPAFAGHDPDNALRDYLIEQVKQVSRYTAGYNGFVDEELKSQLLALAAWAGHDPDDQALAAFEWVITNPKITQSHTHTSHSAFDALRSWVKHDHSGRVRTMLLTAFDTRLGDVESRAESRARVLRALEAWTDDVDGEIERRFSIFLDESDPIVARDWFWSLLSAWSKRRTGRAKVFSHLLKLLGHGATSVQYTATITLTQNFKDELSVLSAQIASGVPVTEIPLGIVETDSRLKQGVPQWMLDQISQDPTFSS